MKPVKIGDVEIHKVVEIERLALPHKFLYTNCSDEIIEHYYPQLGPNLIEAGTNKFFLSFHSYVIRTPTLNILVDTCNGNDKNRPSMPAWHMLKTDYIGKLAAIGLRPEDIDVVMCTHLHADHTGWNTKLENGRWVPTFPKARYLMGRQDLDYFDCLHRANPAQPVNRGAYEDSVLPIVEAGRAELVDPSTGLDGELAKFVSIHAAPGHTPGNMNVNVKAAGKEACLCGDVLHHAIQCLDPILGSAVDYNADDSYRSRLSLLERYADTDTDILTGHFPTPTAGRIKRHGKAFRFAFADH